MIIRTNRELKERYDELKAGDCFIGILRFKNVKHRAFVDLLERGVRFFPSALSQTLAHSKVAQALALKQWMVPHTLIIARRVDCMHAISTYHEHGVGTVVTKEDHLQSGFGIRRWDSMEAVYNQASCNTLSYPFVVQPFLEDYTDIRVVIVGHYYEGYVRQNLHNFRMNLSVGGTSRPYKLSQDQLTLCHHIMKRGKFPYAHIDLLVAKKGPSYLSEIALNGGLKGAHIKREDLETRKKDLLEKMAECQEEVKT